MRSLLCCAQLCGRHMHGGIRKAESSRRLLSSQLAEIREELKQYQDGVVTMEKRPDSGIAILTLSNPGRKNGVSGKMMVELADCVTELSQWQEGTGLVLRGDDQFFCSGGDLTTISALLKAGSMARMSALMQDTMKRLRSLPLVSVALVQGMALGGGAELAAACDIRVMTDSAKFGFINVKKNLTTGFGGTTHLLQLCRRTKSLQLLCSGKIMTASEALDFGVAEHIVLDDPSPLEAAVSLLQQHYCGGSTHMVRAFKGLVAELEGSRNVGESYERERRTFDDICAVRTQGIKKEPL